MAEQPSCKRQVTSSILVTGSTHPWSGQGSGVPESRGQGQAQVTDARRARPLPPVVSRLKLPPELVIVAGIADTRLADAIPRPGR